MDTDIALLEELIRLKPVSKDIPSVNRAEDRMKAYLENHGLHCTMEVIDGRHVLFASTVPGKTPDYLLNAHMDVVPATEEQFAPRIEGTRMYARGTEDCLGSCIIAAKTLIALNGKASCGAIFTADEEIGGHTSAGMVQRGYSAKKCIIIIDAMYDRLAYAQKGIMALELINHSTSGGGHASYPWAFDNPIERLAEGFVNLRHNWKNPTEETNWNDSMTPCVFQAGSVHNQIPDSASLLINIRYIHEEDRDKIMARVKELTGCDEIRIFEECPPVVMDADAPMIKRLRAAMSKRFGREIPLERMMGATDARHFQSLNVPIAMVGVNGAGEHSPCEYVELPSLDFISGYLQDFILE